MSVGAELREARERHNLTLDDISSTTKISVERLNAIEQMDGAFLPAHVYLQGYLRTYATEVHLDPDDIVARYLDEVEFPAPAAAQPPIVEPPIVEVAPGVAVPDVPLAPLAPIDVAPNAPADVLSSFPSEKELDPPVRHWDAQSLDRLDDSDVLPPSGRAFAVVPPSISDPPPRRPSYLPLLIGAVIAVVVGILISANIDRIEEKFPIAAAIPSSDTDRQARRANDAHADQQDAAATDSPEVTADVSGVKENQPAPSTDPAPATSGSRDNANAPASKASADTTPNEAPAKDLTGEWTLTNHVVASSLKTYENLELGFRLQLRQSGNRVTGTGQKLTENGKRLGAKGQSPIQLEGTLNGDRLELHFTERGARRASSGTIFLDVADAATLEGSFRSDAANAQGTSVAKRIDRARE